MTETDPNTLATPELDKLSKINEEGHNQVIGEFLEWAGANGYNFTRTVMMTEERDYLYKEGTYMVKVPVEQPVDIEKVLAEFFEIDLDKVRAEREALFAAVRAASVCQRGATG